ncbi:MAG TPA: hypothetical protein VKU41_28265 [Polyangiaceae bacterium]|nr:hypothetical protein [Polyangiaceae bacterium]
MKTPNVLRKLVRACVDDEKTLLHESHFVDARRAAVLTRMAYEREELVADLEQLLEPAPRRPTGSWRELLREARRTVWVWAAGPNNGDAIGACRRSCARTGTTYDRAMQAPLSEETRRILTAHRRRLQDEINALNLLQF